MFPPLYRLLTEVNVGAELHCQQKSTWGCKVHKVSKTNKQTSSHKNQSILYMIKLAYEKDTYQKGNGMYNRQDNSGVTTPSLRLWELGHLVGKNCLDPTVDACPTKGHDRTQ